MARGGRIKRDALYNVPLLTMRRQNIFSVRLFKWMMSEDYVLYTIHIVTRIVIIPEGKKLFHANRGEFVDTPCDRRGQKVRFLLFNVEQAMQERERKKEQDEREEDTRKMPFTATPNNRMDDDRVH